MLSIKNLMYSIHYDSVTENVMYIRTYACTHVSSDPGMEIAASTNYYHHLMGGQTLLLHSIYSSHNYRHTYITVYIYWCNKLDYNKKLKLTLNHLHGFFLRACNLILLPRCRTARLDVLNEEVGCPYLERSKDKILYEALVNLPALLYYYRKMCACVHCI